MTEAQKKAKKKYLGKVKRIMVELYPTESDLIRHIEKQPNKQGYIKELVRRDMNLLYSESN